MRRVLDGLAAPARHEGAGLASWSRRAAYLAAAAWLLACGQTTGGAREGAAAGVLAPAEFALTLRGMEVSVEQSGTVHAPECDARLDFAAATLSAPDGRVRARLVGDGWPRTLVVGEGDPPVTVSEHEVRAGDRTLFSLEGDGRLLDAGGGAAAPTEIVATGLEPGETTTALALLALLAACWEAPAVAPSN